MAVQKRVLFGAAALLTFFTQRYAPQLTIYRSSFVWNTATIYLLLLSASLAWSVVLYPLFVTPLRKLPTPPGANIFMGHSRRIFSDPSGEPQRDWIDDVPNDGVIHYKFIFNESRVLVTNPKALSEVLVQKNYEFIKPQRLRDGLGRILGVGILLAEGDEHKRQRRMLMPAFSFRHIKDLYPIFWSKSREMTDAISASISASSDATKTHVESIPDWASRATLDIIGLAGLGRDFNAILDPSNELNQTYRRIFGGSRLAQAMQILGNFLPLWFLRALPIKRNEDIVSAIKTIKRVARDLVVSKRAKLEKGERTDLDILSVAIESGGFSDDDLVNQLMTFLAAGHETTASAMSWATYLLCKHPDVQARLREEIREKLPSISDSSTQISSLEIDKLPYLNAVINETMRVFPPVPLTLREAAADSTIQGHFIPAGTIIIICPWAINTSKALWGPDAREFNPERWLAPGAANSGGAESNFAITTFLHGPRSCIGRDFAKAEFACLLASLVGRFEMELADKDYKLVIAGGITARPRDGLNVRMKEVPGW